MCRMIPSAAGERQIFPKQTKSIFVSMAAKIVQDARSAKFIGSCRAAARPKGGACADNPRYNKSDTSYILNSILCTETRTTPLAAGLPIIALERRAPGRWNQGDPDGFLELTSGDVVYFDPALGRKLIGKKPSESTTARSGAKSGSTRTG